MLREAHTPTAIRTTHITLRRSLMLSESSSHSCPSYGSHQQIILDVNATLLKLSAVRLYEESCGLTCTVASMISTYLLPCHKLSTVISGKMDWSLDW